MKLRYPIDPSDDGTPVSQGRDNNITHYPDRNPREIILYYLTDTYGATGDVNVWNKVRAAFYMITVSPEFLVQK